MRTHFLVYMTVNNLNGHFYIGQHATRKLNDAYLGSGVRLRRAVKKYGRENFTRHILKDCETREEMDELEKRLIEESFLTRPQCLNIKPGGQGQFLKIVREKNGVERHTGETKRRISASVRATLSKKDKTEADAARRENRNKPRVFIFNGERHEGRASDIARLFGIPVKKVCDVASGHRIAYRGLTLAAA